ncbi:unnamed protein product [Ranitomeya imitator]|uniref:GIY-YIG domain-containing protein n=1 Tax=Ranitomeya imitator TaxID=111125 RepID=A0ABN9MMQ8_9NEOB|nr:unnamed protein product [Ranitomeya imitator]
MTLLPPNPVLAQHRKAFFHVAFVKPDRIPKNHFPLSRTFEIREHLTCSSQGIVYHATCPCDLIYVGLTSREFKIRIPEHVRDIKKAENIEDISLSKKPYNATLKSTITPILRA